MSARDVCGTAWALATTNMYEPAMFDALVLRATWLLEKSELQYGQWWDSAWSEQGKHKGGPGMGNTWTSPTVPGSPQPSTFQYSPQRSLQGSSLWSFALQGGDSNDGGWGVNGGQAELSAAPHSPSGSQYRGTRHTENRFTCQDIANLVWALGRAQHLAPTLLPRMLTLSAFLLPSMLPEHCAALAWGVSSLGARAVRLITAIRKRLAGEGGIGW